MLVDPLSVDSIAEGIRRVLTQPSLRQDLIDKGRNRSQSFTWERCARQTLEVLERVASPKRVSR
jgi:alpha-1,3-rhamnosyl/mannosyltransferase